MISSNYSRILTFLHFSLAFLATRHTILFPGKNLEKKKTDDLGFVTQSMKIMGTNWGHIKT